MFDYGSGGQLKRSFGKKIQLVLSLAVKDLLFDKKIALCIIFSLVSVIAPLMLLFGLKYGIVNQLNQSLITDPRHREIVILGNKHYEKSWIDSLKEHPNVAFVIPLTRSLNTQADFVSHTRFFSENVEIIPSAIGDPLLNEQSRDLSVDELILTPSAAKKLKADKGSTILMIVSRQKEGKIEKWQIPMKVVDIVDNQFFTRQAAFISLERLIQIENYKDGLIDEHPRGVSDSATQDPLTQSRNTFAKFRLFAKRLDDVKILADWFAEKNIQTKTFQAEIESVKAISFVLSFIFNVIAWITFVGCVASLVGAFLANIDRKRKDLAVMRLLGLSKKMVGAYILTQAITMTVIAYTIALFFYFLGSFMFNQVLGKALPSEQFVSLLAPGHFIIALLLALSVSSLVALIGVMRANRIEPSESLREI